MMCLPKIDLYLVNKESCLVLSRAGVLLLGTRTRVLVTRYSVLLLEYHFLSARKILVLVRLCTRYSFEKAIEYTSTLSNGKARCWTVSKGQLNFVLPCIMSKYVTKSVCSSFTVEVKAHNFFAVKSVPIVIALTQSHIARCAFTWSDFATS